MATEKHDPTSVDVTQQAIQPKPAPFFMPLNIKHKVQGFVIVKPDTDAAKELDKLINKGNWEEYQQKLKEYGEHGRRFIQTENGVKELGTGSREIDITIAVQVKGYTITWYFWTKPEDQDMYPQEWRDQLYDAAAECHTHVTNSCNLYYRGSNAFHLKTMHNVEREAFCNHNHYRMRDNQPVTPEDFRQHLQAFKSEKHTAVRALFFNPALKLKDGAVVDEIDYLCDKFESFYLDWIKKNAQGVSKAEQYAADPSQKLTPADILEFKFFGAQQEPCRLTVDELTVDYEQARQQIEKNIATLSKETQSPEVQSQLEALTASIQKVEMEYKALLDFRRKGGSRGLGADRAYTRQLPGSAIPTHPLPVEIGLDAPPIPEWAERLRQKVAQAVQQFVGSSECNVRALNEAQLTEAGIRAPLPLNPSASRGGFFANSVPAEKTKVEEPNVGSQPKN